jgi:putative transposase
MKAISGRDTNLLKTGEGWGERPREPAFQIQTSKPGLFADILGHVNHSSENELPQRQNPSSGVHIQLGESNIVLLTINTDKREPWLANETAHRLLHQTWSEAKAWLVGDYLLMPDHLHAFCAPQDLQFTIEAWIAYWKRQFSLKHGRTEWKFQPCGWHHRLRDGENYSEKWLYVQENPVRKGLVQRIEEWPFKGRVFDLIWSGK